MALPSLTDLKTHLDITDTNNDDELVDHLDAAGEIVASIVGPLEDATVTEVHRRVCSDVLVLRKMPVGSLVSISSRYGVTPTELTLADYELDGETGIVRSIYGAGFYGDYVVSYSVGYNALPAAISMAVLIIARHLFETQRRPGFTSDAPAGFGGLDGVQDARPTGMGFAIPSRAQELLQPYMRPVIA